MQLLKVKIYKPSLRPPNLLQLDLMLLRNSIVHKTHTNLLYPLLLYLGPRLLGLEVFEQLAVVIQELVIGHGLQYLIGSLRMFGQ